MQKYLLFFALAITLVSSCSIEQRIERREDRLIGTWALDRAFFWGDGALFRDNVTSDFRGDIVTFFGDFTLLYEAGNGEVFDGVWTISALRDLGDDGDDVEFLIDADFFDEAGFVAFQWIGTIERLGRNNFNVRVQERNGELVLKWDRI